MSNSESTVTVKITSEEWNILGAVERFWHLNKHFPGINIICEETGFSEEFVQEVISSERAQIRFKALGIDENSVPLAKRGELKKGQSRLSPIQTAAAEVMLNPYDKRSQTAKLKALGIKPTTYHGWTSNKLFSDYLRQRSEDLFGNAMPMAQDALVRKMMAGETSAIKLYMEIQGRYSKTGQQSSQDFRLLVLRLIEILQKHIKDPALLQIISEDVKYLVDPQPRQVTAGEVIYGEHSPIIFEEASSDGST